MRSMDFMKSSSFYIEHDNVDVSGEKASIPFHKKGDYSPRIEVISDW